MIPCMHRAVALYGEEGWLCNQTSTRKAPRKGGSIFSNTGTTAISKPCTRSRRCSSPPSPSVCVCRGDVFCEPRREGSVNRVWVR